MTDSDADDGRDPAERSDAEGEADAPPEAVMEDDAAPEPDADASTVGPAGIGDLETGVADPGPVRKPSSRIRLKWGGQVLVSVLVLFGLGMVLATQTEPVALWMPVGFALVLGALGVLWTVLRYRRWAFQIREDHLFLQRGVYRHVETVVPYVRIQHVDTQRGPVDRALGLSTLVIYTAGSRGADVAIPGLPAGDAEDLQDRLKRLAIAAEGGDAL